MEWNGKRVPPTARRLPAGGSPPSGSAYEDLWWRNGYGEDNERSWFSHSPEPRHERPAGALRIGDVYTHAMTGARGVVIGWDARLRAPRRWIDSADHWEGQPRSWADRLHRLQQPFHSVLEVTADGRPQQRYVISLCRPLGHPELAKSCLQPGGGPLDHPELSDYFVGFRDDDGGWYEPRPELAQRYPRDMEERAALGLSSPSSPAASMRDEL